MRSESKLWPTQVKRSIPIREKSSLRLCKNKMKVKSAAVLNENAIRLLKWNWSQTGKFLYTGYISWTRKKLKYNRFVNCWWFLCDVLHVLYSSCKCVEQGTGEIQHVTICYNSSYLCVICSYYCQIWFSEF